MTEDTPMPDIKQPKTVQRRGFFTAIGLGGAAAVATAAVSVVVPEAAQAMKPAGGKAGSHYQESEHIKTFYKVNSY
jgi:hypothetical protein